VTAFERERWVPANQVVHDPAWRHPSPSMYAHLQELVGQDKADELAEKVTTTAIALFDTLGDRKISMATAHQLLMLAALAVADEYTSGAAEL
jgi:hypothetical protein